MLKQHFKKLTGLNADWWKERVLIVPSLPHIYLMVRNVFLM